MSGLLRRPEQLEKAAARILLSTVRQHSGSRVLLGVSLRGGAMAGNGKAWTLQPRVCSGTSGQSFNLWSLSLLTCKMATMLTKGQG